MLIIFGYIFVFLFVTGIQRTTTTNHVISSLTTTIHKYDQTAQYSLKNPTTLKDLYYAIKLLEKHKIPIKLPNNTCNLLPTIMDSLISKIVSKSHYYQHLYMINYIYKQKYCPTPKHYDLELFISKFSHNVIDNNENRYFCQLLISNCNCKCPLDPPKINQLQTALIDKVYNLLWDLSISTNPSSTLLTTYNNVFISILEEYNSYHNNNNIEYFEDDILTVILETIKVWLSTNIADISSNDMSKIVSTTRSIYMKVLQNNDLTYIYNIDNIIDILAKRNIYDPSIEIDSIDKNIKIDSSYKTNMRFYIQSTRNRQQQLSLESSIKSLSSTKLVCDGKVLYETIINLLLVDQSTFVYTLPIDFSMVKDLFSNGKSYIKCTIMMDISPKDNYTFINEKFKFDFTAELDSIKSSSFIHSCNINVPMGESSKSFNIQYGDTLTSTLEAYNYETIKFDINSDVYGLLYFKSTNKTITLKPNKQPKKSSILSFSLILSRMGGTEFGYNSGKYTIGFIPVDRRLTSSLNHEWIIGEIDIGFIEEPIISSYIKHIKNYPKDEILEEDPPKLIEGNKYLSLVSMVIIAAIPIFVLIKWNAMGVSIDYSKVIIPSHILLQSWLWFTFSIYLYSWTTINMMTTIQIILPVSMIAMILCKNMQIK